MPWRTCKGSASDLVDRLIYSEKKTICEIGRLGPVIN